ncbi:unnamed protein product [Prorocentrum cordatum]|uniref:Uncharacterized protein n=1 Tax=Prorocentrum cordatum TaxID=2364126 RepID=A0ABN9VL26_9DINO|nr:unnamed protein product [Polarella glacialis]
MAEPQPKTLSEDAKVGYTVRLLEDKGADAAAAFRKRIDSGEGIRAKGIFFGPATLRAALDRWEARQVRVSPPRPDASSLEPPAKARRTQGPAAPSAGPGTPSPQGGGLLQRLNSRRATARADPAEGAVPTPCRQPGARAEASPPSAASSSAAGRAARPRTPRPELRSPVGSPPRHAEANLQVPFSPTSASGTGGPPGPLGASGGLQARRWQGAPAACFHSETPTRAEDALSTASHTASRRSPLLAGALP